MPEEEPAHTERVSNAGRWGASDRLGTLNLVSPAQTWRAAELVGSGITVSWSRQISRDLAAREGASFLHHVTRSGAEAPSVGAYAATDWFGMDIHEYAFTHLDSWSHMIVDGSSYNGTPGSDVSALAGDRNGGVDLAHDGVVTRGVLLDLPRLRGGFPVAPGEGGLPEELELCEQHSNVSLGEGDALLLRVGRDILTSSSPVGRAVRSLGVGGLAPECLAWLHERGVALVCCDGITDPVVPKAITGASTAAFPDIHLLGLASMGLWLIDN